MSKLGIVSIIAFLILLALRLDHMAALGWGVVTAPLWVYGTLAVLVAILFHALKIEHCERE